MPTAATTAGNSARNQWNAKLPGCSLNMVVYWMREYGIKRRSMSEAVYAWRNPTEPFQVPSILSPELETLRAIAIQYHLI